jgi:hypothetical protein
VVQTGSVDFPSTGNEKSWSVLTVLLSFEAGEEARLRLIADTVEGVNVDSVRVSR